MRALLPAATGVRRLELKNLATEGTENSKPETMSIG